MVLTKKEKQAQGKRNRLIGAAFERKTRKDLMETGWIVSKWQNNVDLDKKVIHAAKRNPFGSLGSGFPDFVAFRPVNAKYQKVILIECKVNGRLTKLEKEKMAFIEKSEEIECWIARNEDKQVKYTKFVDYIKSRRVCGRKVKC